MNFDQSPMLVIWEVTQACDLACVHCRASALPERSPKELTTEQGYRLLRRTTRVTTRPLLSRQAVHVLGNDQRFSNEKIRTTLGWTPRTSYAEGLAATVAWLRSKGV